MEKEKKLINEELRKDLGLAKHQANGYSVIEYTYVFTIKITKDVSYKGDLNGHIIDIDYDNENNMIAGKDRNTGARVELGIFDKYEVLE